MITRRLQFVHTFVGYELLDDGDPGAMWVRYPAVEEPGFRPVPAEPHAEGAWQIITPYRETYCQAYFLEAYLTPRYVLALMDAHEARNAEYIKFHRDNGETEEDLGDLIQVDKGMAAIREWMAQEDILPEGAQWP